MLKGGKTVIPDAAINSVKKNTVALKGVSLFIQNRDNIANRVMQDLLRHLVGNTFDERLMVANILIQLERATSLLT